MKKRPSWDEYFLNIAKEISKRGTCIRRNFGAVIVKGNRIESTGYCGAPRGTPNCSDLEKCVREELKIPSGQRYELCRSVHAEMNAVINAARDGRSIVGGTLYLYGEDAKDGSIVDAELCRLCKRVVINVGLQKVIVRKKEGIIHYSVKEWVDEEKKDPFKDLYKEEG